MQTAEGERAGAASLEDASAAGRRPANERRRTRESRTQRSSQRAAHNGMAGRAARVEVTAKAAGAHRKPPGPARSGAGECRRVFSSAFAAARALRTRTRLVGSRMPSTQHTRTSTSTSTSTSTPTSLSTGHCVGHCRAAGAHAGGRREGTRHWRGNCSRARASMARVGRTGTGSCSGRGAKPN